MSQPAVSIILPTFNRARFLPQAFASIRAQVFTNWELIVIDDGSTDNTRELVADVSQHFEQPVNYICQENRGAYSARNTGLDHAKGTFVAFFDSDDEWLPHHLQDCVDGLEANPDVDWVYGACRIVDELTDREIAPSTFYVDGRPRPFLGLNARVAGKLKIIDDATATRLMILHGLYCGPQNSVVRRTLFEENRYFTDYWNEAEDQLIVIRNLVAGRQFAYIDNVHVIYKIHDANSSATGDKFLERKVDVYRACIRGYEDLCRRVSLGPAERLAIRIRLSREYFWHLGYSLLWQNGRGREALQSFRKGLALWPWDWRCWKTYGLAMLLSMCRPASNVAPVINHAQVGNNDHAQ